MRDGFKKLFVEQNEFVNLLLSNSEATPKIVKDSAMEYIYMSICIAASLGVVYSIGSICIYIKYRHKPGIKLLSPTINRNASNVIKY